MAWNYSPTTAGSGKDLVRLLIGDTVQSQPQLDDAEVNIFLAQAGGAGNEYAAAVLCCRALAARYAREVSETVISTSRNPESMMDHYLRLADTLQEQGPGALALAGVPTAGGIELAENLAAEADTTLVPRMFRLGQMDNPRGLPSPEDDDA